MAAFIRASRRSLLSSCVFICSHRQQSSLRSSKHIFRFSRNHASQAIQKSPFESKILRIIRNEIEYQLDYAPPHPPVTKFNTFMVEDRPGEQWITLRRKFGKDEHIKIEATMIDGAITVPKANDENLGDDVRLHISVLVDIWKDEGSEFLEFVCSSWPNSLEIQKVYLLRSDGSRAQPYMGPNVKDLNSDFRDGLIEFLKARGINDELSAFLHEFMMNKDRIEAIGWLRKIQSFIEKSFVYWYNPDKPNVNELTGAIVGGPDRNDNFVDHRLSSSMTEPTTYTNSLAVSVLATLTKHHSSS